MSDQDLENALATLITLGHITQEGDEFIATAPDGRRAKLVGKARDFVTRQIRAGNLSRERIQ